MTFDPRGFKAQCIDCGRTFYIPWETMCDAGICDDCMRKRGKPRASPAKDPIADAVNAQLDPLKAELIDIGHKLAKDDRCGAAHRASGLSCRLAKGHLGDHIASSVTVDAQWKRAVGDRA